MTAFVRMKKVDYSKMRVNYYDFGLYKGVETKWMIDKIFPSLGITNYHIYGFEACTKYANKLKERYEENSRVTIINKAIKLDTQIWSNPKVAD